MTVEYISMHLQPTVIKAPGRYLTRCGETVTITKVVDSFWHRLCEGTYPCSTKDRWHISGRLYSGQLSDNDIVEALP